MAKRKTTVYIDEDVLRSARVAASRQGKRDSEIVEEALRRYLIGGVLDSIHRSTPRTRRSAHASRVIGTMTTSWLLRARHT